MTGPLHLVGTKSPMIVEFEESAARAGHDDLVLVALDPQSRALARHRVVPLQDLPATSQPRAFIACAFSPIRRRQICRQVEAEGFTPAEALVDPTVIPARSTRIDLGSYVNAGVVIGAASLIGAHVVINRATSIGHHCRIGDFASLGPGVVLAGNVAVGVAAIIGAGSTILPDVAVGAGAIVAAGAVVRHDVPDGGFVAGNPATPHAYDPATSIFATGSQE